MKSFIFSIVFIFIYWTTNSQELFAVKKDSSGFDLTIKGASFLASLPLKCIGKEFPNKTNHTALKDSDQVMLPSQLHPAFYGCFDWHSCVHGHWMLVKLLKLFPTLPEASEIRAAINMTITPGNIAKEVLYFNGDLAKGFERTYGWAWLLKLDEELYNWNDEDGKKWYAALQPLTQKVVELWKNFLPKQTYPNRTGVHPNTAFGMAFALDYAHKEKNIEFEKVIVESAKRIYGSDKKAPASWEPDGTDFLSPSLEEADLMRRILSPKEFLSWFNAFLSTNDLRHLSILPVVSDRTDLSIVHLDGLCFSRSWTMKGLASAIPTGDPRKSFLQKASIRLLAASLPVIVSGNYGGEHWLASFAIYALVNN